MSTSCLIGWMWIPLARQKSWLTCVTLLPVSSRAVTGCPLMKIWSSLALPTNFAQRSAWVYSTCPTNDCASFPHVADFALMLLFSLGFSVGECLFSPWGLFKHSPLGTALCLLKWGNHNSNAPPLHTASTGWVCMSLQPPTLAVDFCLLAGEWILTEWEGRPLPPLHVPWVFLPKPPLPKEGFPGLATLEKACVAHTTDTKFFNCPTKASIWCCWYLSCLVSSSYLVDGTVAVAAFALGAALAWPAFPSSSDLLHSSKKCM